MRSSNSQSHPYKIFLCSDDSPNYKVSHVDNKNPSVYWRTDQPRQSAYFEIKFAKAKITNINIMNMFSPQFSVTVFNMNEKGNPIDQYECVPKQTLIFMNDFLSGKVDGKMRNYAFKDDPMMVKIFHCTILNIYYL